MKFDVSVKMKVGTISQKTTVFDSNDITALDKLFEIKNDILDNREKADDQVVTVSTSSMPGFIVNIDKNISREDADTSLSTYFRELYKKIINDEKSSIYNMYNMYTHPYHFINIPNMHGIYNPPTYPQPISPYPFQYPPTNPIYPNVSSEEKTKMQPKQDPDRVKKEMDDMESSKTIGDEYVERMKSAFDDFMGSILEIYKNYKEEKEKELEDEELEED